MFVLHTGIKTSSQRTTGNRGTPSQDGVRDRPVRTELRRRHRAPPITMASGSPRRAAICTRAPLCVCAPRQEHPPRRTAIDVSDTRSQDASAYVKREAKSAAKKQQATEAHHRKTRLETDQLEPNCVAHTGRPLQPWRRALRGGRRFVPARSSASALTDKRARHSPRNLTAFNRPTRTYIRAQRATNDMYGRRDM